MRSNDNLSFLDDLRRVNSALVFFSYSPRVVDRRSLRLELAFDLETKPLARALISYAVRSSAPHIAGEPRTHFELLQAGVTGVAFDITDTVLLLLGRSSIATSDAPSEDAPVIIGFSLLLMLGIVQAVGNEGIELAAQEMTERLIERHLAQQIRAAGDDAGASRDILEISRDATLIPGQIVETAQGEVEELFRRCYSALPAYIQGSDEVRRQLMPMFGTALLVLLQSRTATDDSAADGTGDPGDLAEEGEVQ